MRIAAGLLALALALALAGCGGSDGSGGGQEKVKGQAEKQAEQTKEAEKDLRQGLARKTVDITIMDGKVTPQGRRVPVKVGQKITLHLTSDADEEIHVHSDPEHEYEITAGGDRTFSFTIRTPGQVAVEAHHLDVTIVQLVVRP